MEWIDASVELPPIKLGSYFLKIRWNEKRIGITKTSGFWNYERKVFMTSRGEYKKKHVQWLKED